MATNSVDQPEPVNNGLDPKPDNEDGKYISGCVNLANSDASTDAFWTEDRLQTLRLCRNRAYYKFNKKRRQHLQASLSNYIQREWMSRQQNPSFSAKYLLQVYNKHFNQESAKPSSIRGRGGRRGGGRQPSRSSVDASTVTKRKHEEEDVVQVKEETVVIKTEEDSDHSDKQWTEAMLLNLVHCGKAVDSKMADNKDKDFSTLLHEEWKKIYPNSTLNSRNVKSRLTVYQKTLSDLRHSSKRRKLEAGKPALTHRVSVEVKEEANDTIVDNTVHSNKMLDEVSDEFAPESVTPIKIEPESSVEQACPKHWSHLFHDRDKGVECFLTDQLLQIRKEMEPKYPGCDIYSPRKPKGFSASVLEEWKKFYPNTEETNKTIGYKLAKFDRGPDKDVDERGVKITAKGRIMWSQMMLNNLQVAKQNAIKKVESLFTVQIFYLGHFKLSRLQLL